MTLDEHARLIKAEAKRQGFDACGIAEALPPDPEDSLGHWLERGFHADMDWMLRTRTVRQDVQCKLPGARAVVVVARNYYAERPAAPEGMGRVSRYAWGRDYHRVLHKPLQRLARYIEDLGKETRTYFSIDTGPVMEKVWAARAGLGWIGKNSLLLRRDFGSWLFLGTVITTLELAPDPPIEDHCGSCMACLEACPTRAIVGPALVDSRRCIAYQTIENRGEVPPELARHHGDWVFGCDLCQEVCPWNRKPQPTSEPDFQPRPGHAHLDLDAVARMDETAFALEFSGTPIRRSKLAGLQRNAAIAAKNARPQE